MQHDLLKTLLYYDIWSHPLTEQELFTFLPVNSITPEQFHEQIENGPTGDTICKHGGYYFVKGKTEAVIATRKQRERHAQWMWMMARVSTHIIKRFPFVRAVFVSGDLSKNATQSSSDIDFFIITEPERLWITRSLLILFKKLFLFNRKKFFCLNYFTTADNLLLDGRNVYHATEVATLKPMFNKALFDDYICANSWVKQFFPNFDVSTISLPRTNDRRSLLQKLLEIPFRFFDASKLDEFLMKQMQSLWANRYPEFDEATRKKIFKCTRTESRTFIGNFEEKILAIYNQRLKDFGIQK